jgi:hypothetical protein
MQVIKYFYEEPAALEVLTPDLEPDARQRQASPRSLEAFLEKPRYYRGYLAGTDLATGRVGLTALAQPLAFIQPLVRAFPGLHWGRAALDGTLPSPADVRAVLADPAATAVLAGATDPVPAPYLTAAGHPERRQALPALRALLDVARIVLIPEPAHHGFDWSLFSAEPLREPLVAAFRDDPRDEVRRFVIPIQRARSEQMFYFEQWRLGTTPLPDYVEEI